MSQNILPTPLSTGRHGSTLNDIKKMIGWGADVPGEKKDALVKYLSSHFGPDNDRFQPVVTRPIGR